MVLMTGHLMDMSNKFILLTPMGEKKSETESADADPKKKL